MQLYWTLIWEHIHMSLLQALRLVDYLQVLDLVQTKFKQSLELLKPIQQE